MLYALGGSGGGRSCYMLDGHLCFEYNLMIVSRTLIKFQEKLTPGKMRPSMWESTWAPPVACDYFDRPPFRFDGTIRKAQVQLK